MIVPSGPGSVPSPRLCGLRNLECVVRAREGRALEAFWSAFTQELGLRCGRDRAAPARVVEDSRTAARPFRATVAPESSIPGRACGGSCARDLVRKVTFAGLIRTVPPCRCVVPAVRGTRRRSRLALTRITGCYCCREAQGCRRVVARKDPAARPGVARQKVLKSQENPPSASTGRRA